MYRPTPAAPYYKSALPPPGPVGAVLTSDGSSWVVGDVVLQPGGNIPSPPSPSFADAETPSGITDGINKTFGLQNTPSPATSLILVMNGIVQSAGGDYVLTNNTLTMTVAPNSLLAWYRY